MSLGARPVRSKPHTVIRRCFWVPDDDPLYRDYHDREWGRPVAGDRRLFEKLSLEAFQAGLSWRTILHKRAAFRDAFAGFDPATVAGFDEQRVAGLLDDERIVRNEAKIRAVIANAARARQLAARFGSLAAFVWRFEPDPSQRPVRVTDEFVRSTSRTAASADLAGALKRHGWRFVGPTTAYAFMQAVGLVNDHTEDCGLRPAVASVREGFARPA